MFRELGYDMVEHCARAKGGDNAVGFDGEWCRYFGLGNATGLGLVPYAFKHPRVLDAWVGVREMALADVRERVVAPTDGVVLRGWIAKAREHFASGSNDDCTPFLNSQALVPLLDDVAEAWGRVADGADPYDALYLWAENQGPETSEMVVSLLLELHDGDDDLFDLLSSSTSTPQLIRRPRWQRFGRSLMNGLDGWVNSTSTSRRLTPSGGWSATTPRSPDEPDVIDWPPRVGT